MSAAFTQDINPLVAEISSGGPPGAANGQADRAALAALCRASLTGEIAGTQFALCGERAARLAALAMRARMTMPCARAFAAASLPMPTPLAKGVDQTRARAAISNGRVMALARIAFPVLARARIPALAFKGPFQHRQLHGDAFFCRSGDLDLLVAREDFDAALAAFAAEGFAPREDTSAWWRMMLGEVHLVHPEGGVIDLHHRLQQPGCPPPRDIRAFLGASRTETVGGVEIAVPTHAQAVLIAALNFTKEFAHRRPSARYAYDVAAGILAMGEARRRAFAALAEDQRLEGTVGLATALCERIFAITLPLAAPLAKAALPGWADRDALLAMAFDPDASATVWPRRRAVLWALCSRGEGRSGGTRRASEFSREAARMFASEALRRAVPAGSGAGE